MKGVAIVSGGMDSITMLEHHKESIDLVVNFNYGSKHNHREQVFARLAAERLGKDYRSIDFSLNGILKSDLLKDGGEIPEGHYEDLSMKRTVVPFRNGIMLSIAAGIADSNDANYLFIGNHFGDHAIYPDCRASFIDPMKRAIQEGTYSRVVLCSPFVCFTKREIALLGQKIGVDYSQTYSCYKGGEKHCGKCGTCVERKEALEGFDPTEYEG